MDIDAAHSFITSKLPMSSSQFIVEGQSLPVGVGKIFSNIKFSVYVERDKKFVNCIGTALVLTHECDIDQNNDKHFNDYLLICPIIDFQNFYEEFNDLLEPGEFKSFLSNLAERKVSRLVYLPEYPPHMPYGGIIYLNQITNTYINELESGKAVDIGSLTAIGLQVLDYSLVNHLLRPKSVSLPFQNNR